MGVSAESAQMRSLMAGTKAAMFTSDGSVAIRLKYTGTGTVTSVTVTTATNIVMVTSDGGTETFAFSSYSTVGALVDAIEGSGYWSAKALDSLRADATASKFVDGAITIGTAGYYDVLVDTSAMKALTYRCTYDRNVNKDIPAGNHRVRLGEFTYYATLGAAAANGVRIYEYDRTSNSETQIYQALSVSATVTTVNFASGKQYIDSGFNNDLIVRLIDGTSLSDTGAFFQIRYVRE